MSARAFLPPGSYTYVYIYMYYTCSKSFTDFLCFSSWLSFADGTLLKMAQGLESIESKVFREHSSSFIKAITSVTPVANRLREKSLIDHHTYNEVTERASGLSQLEKATEVVKVLQTTVSLVTKEKERQEVFEQILSIFSEFTPLRYIVNDAREAYGEDIGLRTLLLFGFPKKALF